MENYKLSKDYCENIIKVFSENETMQTFVFQGIPINFLNQF